MDLKKKYSNDNSNDKAVSPVIGVVLMVAITVILAAAIGSSVFGQGSSESAPQANINIIASDSTHIKLEHLGGDTVLLNDPTSTQIIFTNKTASYTLDSADFTEPFDVGMTKVLLLTTEDGNTSATLPQPSGEFVTVKIVDIKTKQLIADKELRF